jgi:hypothetical protein
MKRMERKKKTSIRKRSLTKATRKKKNNKEEALWTSSYWSRMKLK